VPLVASVFEAAHGGALHQCVVWTQV